ncbi:MAG: hypothetical protein Devi2KO_14910 [Devosia indica]
MKPEQLELFTGTKPEGVFSKSGKNVLIELAPNLAKIQPAQIASPESSIMPFPAHRLVAHVRRVARAMDARCDRLAAKYLRTERSRLVGRLQAQGFSRAVANGEGDRFAAAVERQRRTPDKNNHGDAA